MRIGSLCSGIGGLELGLERAGLGHTAWQCEYDPHASEVLARHWDVPNHGDVKLTDWSTVEPVDVICAGYPCQPFSTAGRRQGTDDERHLWPAVRDAVGVLGPRLVVLENVRGHLSLGFPEVLGDLADLGFDAGWCLLRASDVGAPHQRARLFVAAWNTDSPSPDTRAEGRGPRDRPGESGSPAPDAQVERGERDGRPRDGRARLADASGLAAPHADEPGPQGPQPAGRHDLPTGSDPLPADPDTVLDWGPYRPAIERWEAIHGPAPAPTVDGRLSPDFVCWMQGFPEGWVDGLTRTAALRCLGNAVVPQVAERFGRMILGEVGGGVVPLDTLLPTPTANQPGGTAECHMERKLAMGRSTATVTDLGMLVTTPPSSWRSGEDLSTQPFHRSALIIERAVRVDVMCHLG